MIQHPLQHSGFNKLDHVSLCEDTEVILAANNLPLQSGLISMEQSASCISHSATDPDFLRIGASDLPGSKRSCSSKWPPGMNESASLAMRGRPVRRTNRLRNPLERAESRKRMRDATVEVDLQSIKLRYCQSMNLSEDLTDPYTAFKYNLFEPCPHDPICAKVSEIISGSGTSSRSGVDTPTSIARMVRTNSNKFHFISRLSICSSTSLLVNSKVLFPAPTFTAGPIPAIMPKPNRANHLGFKSSSEIRGSKRGSECKLSCTNLLPAEILSQIYSSLSPADFNAARHTCRLWFIHSLDHAILEAMLRRGGWSTYIPAELEYNTFFDEKIQVNNEWLMSKRLSRECALGPDWTGNGLNPTFQNFERWSTKHNSNLNPFIHLSTTDFTELGAHYPGIDDSASGILFTVSACCRFLMVAHGCLIYVFELNDNDESHDNGAGEESSTLRPVTSVVCPRRVLACSMDTSSHRYAIAVLMDGRMGLVCDLTNMKRHTQRMSVNRQDLSQEPSSSRSREYRNRISISSSQLRGQQRSQTEQPFVFPIIAAELSQTNFRSDLRQSLWDDTNILPDSLSAAGESQSTGRILFGQSGFHSRAANHFLPSSIPVESSVPNIYASLCSADDAPRSVALCPQRRCVAFGCSSGIELHWVDALTGQDLNRWFPLTAPSDYLYFLPPRPGVDSAKKLRLISSAGQPEESSVIAQRFRSGKSGNHDSPFWGAKATSHGKASSDLASTSRAGLYTSSRDNSDHFRAVPLSDGYHVLFIDPSTGFLCLGSDAPVGGPTKLLRKMWFEGPQGQGSPVVYTGGSDLKWGVRVVAAYGTKSEQSIWLFSIPPDVYTETLLEQGNIILPYMGATYDATNTCRDWIPWWSRPKSGNSPGPAYGASHNLIVRHDGLWPIEVRGQEIGRCYGVVDLAIDAGPDMKIWAFGRDGSAKTWMLDNGSLDTTPERKILVMRDGTIRTSDANGDIQMVDSVSPPYESPLPDTKNQDQETYDGSASLHSSATPLPEQNTWSYQVGGSDRLGDYMNLDPDGDVLMGDLPLPSPESPIYESWTAAMDQYGREEVLLVNHEDRCFACPAPTAASTPPYFRREELDGRDLVDMLTGIARIEIEIW